MANKRGSKYAILGKMELIDIIEDHEETIEDLEHQIEYPFEDESMVGQWKLEFLKKNWHKFTLEDLESMSLSLK